MILLFSHTLTPRLQYVSRFVFGEMMGAEFRITSDKHEFTSGSGCRINYSNETFTSEHGNIFTIHPYGLLFESDIRKQEIKCEKADDSYYFFQTGSGNLRFDILSAIFYLISRYEEYVERDKDQYGRFPHQSSLAFREGFLSTPLVNQWIIEFTGQLKRFFSELILKQQDFRFIPTYDIDIAYSYKGKGFLRNLGGLLTKPSAKRLSVLFSGAKDPFDSYDYLDQLHRHRGLDPVYFFLVAAQTGQYDKNISRESDLMTSLIRRYSSMHKIGIHPSWKSNEDKAILKEEKKFLEETAARPVSVSRQHYIKMNLPQTYRSLIDAGITDDHSMGYGSINGFRASTAHAFNWYDLENETETALRIHPFCFMEANCYYEMKLTPEQGHEDLLHYYEVCKKYRGTLITIFHNNFLGTDKVFKGWREVYSRFISQVQQ